MRQPSGTGETGEQPGSMTRRFMERDRVLNGLGMVVEEVRPGYARLSLTIADGHLNDLVRFFSFQKSQRCRHGDNDRIRGKTDAAGHGETQ